MAKLIIERTSEWNNGLRDIGIYLDGEKIAVIGNGEIKDFEIKSGEHTLKSKIDWCGSETLTINLSDNEIKKIELSGFKLGKFMLPIAAMISIIFFTFKEKLILHPILLMLLILPFLFYVTYHFTLGRNKYLRLEEK
ncbi:hypothetical protein [Algoriphagus aquimarinus]|uniref:DUF2846 domain-containing protein n=1 Tax=Algoriphagus aquimarinus TaxID=237018 RepID=A0A5C7AG38_9BACT|nr:hypothetical protein [Algoriphagus aquimarinus]TXE02272.1 hypothetical protein ESV85_21585 [Algoriphagus aquimarinus]